ncbi:MAG: hypothetical protein ABI435_07035 [Pseudolysinimonas sp.]
MDFSALTAPPRPDERTFLRMPAGSFATYVANVLIGVLGAFALGIGTWMAVSSSAAGRPVTATMYLILALIAIALIAGAIIRTLYRRRRYGVRSVVMVPRLPAFAAANGLRLEAESTDIPVSIIEPTPSMKILDRRVRSRLRPADFDPTAPAAFEVGDFHWRADYGGGNRGIADYVIGYLAVRLPRTLPAILLQSRAPGGSIRVADTTQVLSLEGDWDRHFTLYCPTGYERDALQIMTPDVMAAMIDGAAGWTAETAGDWLLFTLRRPFAVSDASDYERAFHLVEVARDFREQAEHYSDARVGNRSLDVVAAAGSTLRGGRSWAVIAAFIAPFAFVALFLVLPMLAGGR